jgi:hypothetical protein
VARRVSTIPPVCTAKRSAGLSQSNRGRLRVGRHARPQTAIYATSVSGVSTIETDQRFSGREDFWIIVAARSEDEAEIRAGKAAGGGRDQEH